MRSPAGSDPFGTERLRATVLAAWAASPARFREDANAEEELARGAYRDRVVVELAQNAGDAAARSGVGGRLLLRLDGATLLAANTGAPLDAAGVEGLSTLRASTKRDENAVGRFGVGFAAVLGVSDEPAVLSRTGGVRWSRAEAVAAAAAVPELADELVRRGSAVPVLRLPMPAGGEPPAGYETVVRLPLRDDAALELTRSLLDAVDDALVLSLPNLAEIVIDNGVATRTLSARRSGTDVRVTEGARETHWRLVERTGRVPADLLAERPVEEPDQWRVAVAVPVRPDGRPEALPPSVPKLVHAPTPTDERTELPALVLASFPLDSSRRRAVPGRLTDMLAGEVATAYADLVTELAAAGPAVLDLVPPPLPVSELDATLHRAIVPALAEARFVPAADLRPQGSAAAGPGQHEQSDRLAPRDAVLVNGLRMATEPAALRRFVPGLADPRWWRAEPLRRLGARIAELADVVDALGEHDLEPAEWRDLYDALEGADLEALATLAVPLADGRLVRGARGVLLPGPDVGPETLMALGLRVAAASAVHPLLARLGATEATPAAVLRESAVRTAVDAQDEAVAEPVLRLVGASGLTVEDEPWLANTLIPDGTGSPAPAGELWFPGAGVLDVLDVDHAEYTVDPAVVEQSGRDVLAAVGVREGFAVVVAPDVALDEDSWHDLDDEAGWKSAIAERLPGQELPAMLTELVAVRDLDLVHEDRWADAVAMLAADQQTRRALTEPAHALLADGSRRDVPSYTAWWLREHGQFGGVPLRLMSAADADPLVRRLLPAIPVPLDDAVSRALGLARTMSDLVTQPDRLLDRLADPAVHLTAADLAAIYAVLIRAGLDPEAVPPPEQVRIPDADRTRVVRANEVVVADGPHWLQLAWPAVLPGGAELATLLDLPLASVVSDPYPQSTGRVSGVPDAVVLMLPEAAATYLEHDDLQVAGGSVDWWVDPDRTVHAATTDGLARGLAWAAGRWDVRLELAEVLRDPSVVSGLLAERAFESPARDSSSDQ
ncbi:MAG TPA: hypothetical protein VFZ63_16160 [Jiangellaceae bacterium]